MLAFRRRQPVNALCRSGAVLPLVAMLLPIVLVLAGFAINIAYIQLCQTELQISTDVAAKAAGRTFAKDRDPTMALAIANRAGRLNTVAGEPLSFDMSDINIGVATLAKADGRYEFVPDDGSMTSFNSLEILGHRDGGSSLGEIATFFPNFMGTGSFGLSTTSVSTQVEVDVAVVLDRSGSMAYADDEPAVFPPFPAAAPADWEFGDEAPKDSRWRDAVSAVKSFLADLTISPLDERVSLVTYADGARIDKDLTDKYHEIESKLADHTKDLDGGGTNISAGMQAGQAALSTGKARDFSAKVVIVMTDGKVSVGGSPTGWARSLADDGIMIITITFSNEADQSLMKNVAAIGNGFHIHAKDSTALTEAFKSISRKLPTMLTR